MKMYIIRGVTRGLSEKILSVSKKRASEISELRKIGIVEVRSIDKKPKLRVAVNGENEMLDFLEWKDGELNKWHSAFTIDPILYSSSQLEIIKKVQ